MDYGEAGSTGDTFQAVKSHEKVSTLATPGEADLTAHVDFTALAEAATPASCSNATPQGAFLEALGITMRAQKLAQKLDGQALDNHIAAHRRLTHPDEMGTLFKVMAIYADGTPPPPGVSV